ncbi:MAG TPA: hypothetical protein VFX02_04055 [Gammaproteobacteria bacterium]|nr:hypothetical protein [Gammaproteobacteria bacterium]
MMRVFINLFVTGFALDAAVSTVDDVTRLLLERNLLGAPRAILAFAVLFLSPFVYLACGLDSRLPKLWLLPPAVFAMWAGFGALPLPLFFEGAPLQAAASLMQLILAACVFAGLKKQTGDWLPPPEFYARPAWRLRSTLGFALGNVLLVPVALALLLASSAFGYLRHNTGGFVHFAADGVQLEERSYTRDGRTVRLIPMIHVGSAAHYRELSAVLADPEALVLMEGVSDREDLLKTPLSYSKMAGFIGLDVQEHMALPGRVLEYEDLDTPGPAHTDDDGPDIVRADIDSSELSEETRQFIESVGALFDPEDSFLESFKRYSAWYQANMTPELERAVFAEIIGKRNEALLRHLDRALPGHDLILIPWGAMHMPGLETGLIERGFSPAGSTRRLAIAFKDLLGNGASAPEPADGAEH